MLIKTNDTTISYFLIQKNIEFDKKRQNIQTKSDTININRTFLLNIKTNRKKHIKIFTRRKKYDNVHSKTYSKYNHNGM